MAEQTTNFNLKKPAPEDFYSVEDFNGNMDILDAEIKVAQDKATQAFQSASDGKGKIKTAITGIDPSVTIPTDATFTQLATAIGQIKTGVDTGDATATAEGILAGLTAYVKGVKVTGAIPDNSGKTSEAMASAVQTGAILVRPPKGYYDGVSGSAVRLADANFIPDNILSGKSIFGLQGGIPNRSGNWMQSVDVASGDNESGGGRILLKPPAGYYDAGTNSRVIAESPDFLPSNILSSKNIFGRQGSIPIQSGMPELPWSNSNGDSGVDFTPPRGYWNGGEMAYIRDSNLIPANILSGSSIFGVAGTAVQGKRWASGTGTVNEGTYYAFYSFTKTQEPQYLIGARVSGLAFTPTLIIVMRSYGENNAGQSLTFYRSDGFQGKPDYKIVLSTFNFWALVKSTDTYTLGGDAYVNSNGFLLPIDNSTNNVFSWWAYE